LEGCVPRSISSFSPPSSLRSDSRSLQKVERVRKRGTVAKRCSGVCAPVPGRSAGLANLGDWVARTGLARRADGADATKVANHPLS
jgi:hypothetical protein